jgi:hypothetical protein
MERLYADGISVQWAMDHTERGVSCQCPVVSGPFDEKSGWTNVTTLYGQRTTDH